MKKVYNKLIRDRIPEIMDRSGVKYELRNLDDAEFGEALRTKLTEEAGEVANASRSDLAKEIADLLEVLHAIASLEGLDLRDIENVRLARARDRGAFRKRLQLEWTEE